MLAGCAGGSVRRIDAGGGADADIDMTGRWILSAPNAPSCGMNFAGAPGAQRRHHRAGGRLPGQILHQPALDARAGRADDQRRRKPAAGAAHFRRRPLRRPIHRRHAGDADPLDSSATIRNPMAEYQLYCFAQSGNAYRAALMLNLIGADWEPVWVDFFGAGVAAHARVSRGRQRDGRSAGAGARRQEAHPVGRDPHLSRRPHRQVQAAGRGRAAGSAALDHLRQPEGQRLPRAVPLPEEFRQAGRRSGGDGVPERRASTAISPSSTSG